MPFSCRKSLHITYVVFRQIASATDDDHLSECQGYCVTGKIILQIIGAYFNQDCSCSQPIVCS